MYKILIASYESLRKHSADLAGYCDVLVCDEGHRLKAAAGSKTMDSLLTLSCKRRILLTGTPLQNNLDEFWGKVLYHRIFCRLYQLLMISNHCNLLADRKR